MSGPLHRSGVIFDVFEHVSESIDICASRVDEIISGVEQGALKVDSFKCV